MGKELCKIQGKLMACDMDSYIQLVDNPKHVCKKCGRVANKKKLLCKPKRIKRKPKPR